MSKLAKSCGSLSNCSSLVLLDPWLVFINCVRNCFCFTSEYFSLDVKLPSYDRFDTDVFSLDLERELREVTSDFGIIGFLSVVWGCLGGSAMLLIR